MRRIALPSLAVAFAITRLFALPPMLAVGLMLLAASPGGVMANVFSHLAHGDVALNITLTAINSLLALVWLPLVMNLALGYFLIPDVTFWLALPLALSAGAVIIQERIDV